MLTAVADLPPLKDLPTTHCPWFKELLVFPANPERTALIHKLQLEFIDQALAHFLHAKPTPVYLSFMHSFKKSF